MGHRLFFRRVSQNRDYIQTFCNDRRNTFHFACQKWYSHNNPQFKHSIITHIRIIHVVIVCIFLRNCVFVLRQKTNPLICRCNFSSPCSEK